MAHGHRKQRRRAHLEELPQYDLNIQPLTFEDTDAVVGAYQPRIGVRDMLGTGLLPYLGTRKSSTGRPD